MQRFLKTLIFFLLVTQICFAQWVHLGLEDKGIKDIAARNSNIFAVTTDSVVYRSTDNGISWLQIVNSGALEIAIAPSGSLFMMGQDQWYGEDSLYKSYDNGNTWVNLNIMEQLPLLSSYFPFNVTVSPAGYVFCHLIYAVMSYHDALALSTDDGLTWTSPGDTVFGGELLDFRGQSVITSGRNSFELLGNSYIYLSSDNGQTWLKVCESGLGSYADLKVLNKCLNGDMIIGGSWNLPTLFLSDDSCNNVTQVSSLLPETGLSIESGGVLVGTDTLGVFLFSDNGDSLGSFNEGLSNLKTHTLSMDNNGYVYLGTDNGVWRRPLSEIPVELTSFTATANGEEVILNWSTATELNNRGFEIKRSIEGKEFFTVGFVNGHGTTTELHNYSYADKNLNNGKYYYRLKQVDYDGSYEYSDVVEVEWRAFNSYLLEQNWPNPFNPTTTIGFGIQNKSNVKITILNVIGEEVAVILNEEKEAGYHQVEFRAANLPSGVYFYRMQAGSFVQTKKMILLK